MYCSYHITGNYSCSNITEHFNEFKAKKICEDKKYKFEKVIPDKKFPDKGIIRCIETYKAASNGPDGEIPNSCKKDYTKTNNNCRNYFNKKCPRDYIPIDSNSCVYKFNTNIIIPKECPFSNNNISHIEENYDNTCSEVTPLVCPSGKSSVNGKCYGNCKGRDIRDNKDPTQCLNNVDIKY